MSNRNVCHILNAQVLAYFLRGKLPWQGLDADTKDGPTVVPMALHHCSQLSCDIILPGCHWMSLDVTGCHWMSLDVTPSVSLSDSFQVLLDGGYLDGMGKTPVALRSMVLPACPLDLCGS